MVTTSYPRFPGDSVGTFMEPIAKGVAARGHTVHVVAPWHPLVTRRPSEEGVHFHFYKYAPHPSLNVFGYAAAMKADVSLRAQAFVAAPLALAAGWRTARKIARRHNATIMHGHWVIPGGVTAAAAASGRPLVISLHGSDVYVAERLLPARVAARCGLSQGCVRHRVQRRSRPTGGRARSRSRTHDGDPVRRRRRPLSSRRAAPESRFARSWDSRRCVPDRRRRTSGPQERVRVPDRRDRPTARANGAGNRR